MFVNSASSGAPAIVFVHGFGCDHTDWDAQVVQLAATRAVIACDLRGRLAADESSPWLELVRGHVPDARIEVVAGVGHFVQIEAAARVNALLTEFVGLIAQV